MRAKIALGTDKLLVLASGLRLKIVPAVLYHYWNRFLLVCKQNFRHNKWVILSIKEISIFCQPLIRTKWFVQAC